MGEITWAIMAHPSRSASTGEIALRLRRQGVTPRIYLDKSSSGSWLNAKKFWKELNAGFGVLVQDDVIIPDSFVENVRRIVESGAVDPIVSGFWPTKMVPECFEKGYRYIRSTRVVAPCIIAESSFMKEMLDWEETAFKPNVKADDHRYMAFLYHKKKTSLITVPTLVDHKEIPSVDGSIARPWGRRRISQKIAWGVLDWELSEDRIYNGYKDRPTDFEGELNDGFL